MLNLYSPRSSDGRNRVDAAIPEIGTVVKPAGIPGTERRANASTDRDPVSAKYVRLRFTLVTRLTRTPGQAQISTDSTARGAPVDGIHGHDHRHSARTMLDRRGHDTGKRQLLPTGLKRQINTLIGSRVQQPICDAQQDTGIQDEALFPGENALLLTPGQRSGDEDQQHNDSERKIQKIGPKQESHKEGNNAG